MKDKICLAIAYVAMFILIVLASIGKDVFLLTFISLDLLILLIVTTRHKDMKDEFFNDVFIELDKCIRSSLCIIQNTSRELIRRTDMLVKVEKENKELKEKYEKLSKNYDNVIEGKQREISSLNATISYYQSNLYKKGEK